MPNAQYLFALYQDILNHSQSMLRLAANSQWEELTDREVNHYLGAVEKLTQVMQQQQITPTLRICCARYCVISLITRRRSSNCSSIVRMKSHRKSSKPAARSP